MFRPPSTARHTVRCSRFALQRGSTYMPRQTTPRTPFHVVRPPRRSTSFSVSAPYTAFEQFTPAALPPGRRRIPPSRCRQSFTVFTQPKPHTECRPWSSVATLETSKRHAAALQRHAAAYARPAARVATQPSNNRRQPHTRAGRCFTT